jgi:hypothetical protein
VERTPLKVDTRLDPTVIVQNEMKDSAPSAMSKGKLNMDAIVRTVDMGGMDTATRERGQEPRVHDKEHIQRDGADEKKGQEDGT